MPVKYVQPQNSGEALLVINGLPVKQRDVLGQIALDNDGGHNNRTVEALIAKGLVEEFWVKDVNSSELHYRTPIFVHMAWCEWCSRNTPEPK